MKLADWASPKDTKYARERTSPKRIKYEARKRGREGDANPSTQAQHAYTQGLPIGPGPGAIDQHYETYSWALGKKSKQTPALPCTEPAMIQHVSVATPNSRPYR